MNNTLTTEDRGQTTAQQRPSLLPVAFAGLPQLIRNDEALIQHYAQQLEGVDGIIDALPEQSPERASTLRKMGDRIRLLQRRRAALEYFQPLTPATGAPENLGGFLVTTTAPSPGVNS